MLLPSLSRLAKRFLHNYYCHMLLPSRPQRMMSIRLQRLCEALHCLQFGCSPTSALHRNISQARDVGGCLHCQKKPETTHPCNRNTFEACKCNCFLRQVRIALTDPIAAPSSLCFASALSSGELAARVLHPSSHVPGTFPAHVGVWSRRQRNNRVV